MKLVLLPSVESELYRIHHYIADELCNVSAALEFIEDFEKAFTATIHNPKIGSIYPYGEDLAHEYRKKVVRGHIILYWIDEVNKLITVSHIFNTRTNYQNRRF